MAQNGVNNPNNQVVIAIWDQIQTQGNRTKQDCDNRRIIRRIPPLLRRNEFFDPKIVSIGPYHHGKPDLQMAEKFKPRVAQLLFPNRQHDVDSLYREILLEVPQFRSCYEPEPELTQKLNDPQFAQMMFLDCCLLLALLEPFFPNSPFTPGEQLVIFNFNLSFSSMSYESFFLLENQLPFTVLTLVAARLLSVDVPTATYRIAQAVQAMPGLVLHNRVTNPTSEEGEPAAVHLFELHYRKVLSNPTNLHGPPDNENRVDIADLVVTYRSATDLKSRGIHFRRRQSGLLGDVKFTSYLFSGKLEISPFFISSNFEIMVWNATAYEQSPYGPPMKPRVISFFTFLRSLIDSPDDVKELRSKRIINTLGMSDEHVARLFEKMNVGKDDPNMYYAVRKSIDQHYNNGMKTSMAQLRRSYFNSPWAFIVFLAAATGLAMAIVQAYYTIHPVSK